MTADLFPDILRRKGHRPAARPDEELIVDNFAGGGGASMGIEMALNRCVDLAVNHDPDAIAMHEVNHPATTHHTADVFDIDPIQATGGRPVGFAWFSPDCTHHSKARGGKPREKKIRALAWVVLRWASLPKGKKPRVIVLENVEEFQNWGPLDKNKQPIKSRKGETFELWKHHLMRCGYRLEYRELRACDYGAPTIRKRLFVIARCDGLPIVWPEATHGAEPVSSRIKPYRTAAECIDWSIECPSIFTRKRPLKENTLKRIARGIQKFVVESADPFIIPVTHTKSTGRAQSIGDPLRTITTAKGGEFALVSPYVVGAGGPAYSGKPIAIDRPYKSILTENHSHLVATFMQKYHGAKGDEARGQALPDPFKTLDTQNRFGLVAANLTKFRGQSPGSAANAPLHTITSGAGAKRPAGAAHAMGVVASNLVKLRGTCRDGQRVDEPMPTITAGGMHVAEVRAFLLKYYGASIGQKLDDPAHTITAKARLGLVTVHGEDYQIVDIGMRMLTARELARAQGFPDNYVLNGTKECQIAKIGNSVCPPIAAALAAANVPEMRREEGEDVA